MKMVRTEWPVFMTFARAKLRDIPPQMQIAAGAGATLAVCVALWFVDGMMFRAPATAKLVETPIISVIAHLDERMVVVAEEGGGGFVAYRPVIDAVWTGPVDDNLIRNATGVLYERLRVKVNPYLATIHEKSEGKLFLRIWLHLKAPDHELAYLRANSGELAHVIPPWKDAIVEFSWPIEFISQPEQRRSLDPSSRPARDDEDLYYAYRDAIERDAERLPGESISDWSDRLARPNRREINKAIVRPQFLRDHGLTEKQLRRIEAHHYLWTWGEKVTPERIDEYLNPSEQEESP